MLRRAQNYNQTLGGAICISSNAYFRSLAGNISPVGKKYAIEKESLKQGLAPISLKRPATELTLGEQVPAGVCLLFPNGLRAHFGCGSEKLLLELLTLSLKGGHV